MVSSPLAVAQSCVLMAIHNTDKKTRHVDTTTITFPVSQPLLTVTEIWNIVPDGFEAFSLTHFLSLKN